MDDLTRVHTHELNDGRRLSRLNAYRLKAARRRRDEAIATAHERYARDVATLTGDNDRLATLALVRGEAANTTFSARQPADELIDPQPSAMTGRMAVSAGILVRHLASALRGKRTMTLSEFTLANMPLGTLNASELRCLQGFPPFTGRWLHASPPCTGYVKPLPKDGGNG